MTDAARTPPPGPPPAPNHASGGGWAGRLAGELARFATVGVFATLLYAALAFAFVQLLEAKPTTASVAAYAIAAVASYLGQSRFTFRVAFRAGGRDHVHIPRFAVTTLLGLGVSFAAVRSAEAVGAPYAVGVAAVCVLIPLLSFAMMKLWVFADRL